MITADSKHDADKLLKRTVKQPNQFLFSHIGLRFKTSWVVRTNMPKCPKCGEEIDSLVATYIREASRTVKADDIDTIEGLNFAPSGEYYEWACPKCLEKIAFDDKWEAEAFLRGEPTHYSFRVGSKAD